MTHVCELEHRDPQLAFETVYLNDSTPAACRWNRTDGAVMLGRGHEGSAWKVTTPCGLAVAMKEVVHKGTAELTLASSSELKDCRVLHRLAKESDACDACVPRYFGMQVEGTKAVCFSSLADHAVRSSTMFPVKTNFHKLVPPDQHVDVFRSLLLQAFDVVRIMDRHDILHTDLKLGNILIANTTAPGDAKHSFKLTVIDFGYAAIDGLYAKCRAGIDRTLAEWTTGEKYVERFGPDKVKQWRGPCAENAHGMGRTMVNLVFRRRHSVPPEVLKHPDSLLAILSDITHDDYTLRLRDPDVIRQRLLAATTFS